MCVFASTNYLKGNLYLQKTSNRLTAEYGKGFEKSSVFKIVKFYQEFPEYEKVATLSLQYPAIWVLKVNDP